VVHVERIDTAELARAVEELYRGELEHELWEGGLSGRQMDPFRLSGSIADALEHFREQDPERIERLWQRILGYHAGLAAYRIRDGAVRTRLERTAERPTTCPGGSRSGCRAGRRTTRRPGSSERRRIPALLGARDGARRVGGRSPLGGRLFFSLPLGGLIAYRYLVGTGQLRHQLRFGALLLTRAQEARRLLAERREIVEELERTKRDYLGGTKGPSV